MAKLTVSQLREALADLLKRRSGGRGMLPNLDHVDTLEAAVGVALLSGCDLAETAVAFGRSKGHVKVLQSHIRKKLSGADVHIAQKKAAADQRKADARGASGTKDTKDIMSPALRKNLASHGVLNAKGEIDDERMYAMLVEVGVIKSAVKAPGDWS